MAGNDSAWLPSIRSAKAFARMFLQSSSTSELVRYAGVIGCRPSSVPRAYTIDELSGNPHRNFLYCLGEKNPDIKAMVFPVVMYGCESWTIKKAECLRIDAFELWCWRRLLRVPWTARRSNQSILKEISPGCVLWMVLPSLASMGPLAWPQLRGYSL